MIWIYVIIAVCVLGIAACIAYESLAEYADGGAFIAAFGIGIALLFFAGVAIATPLMARHDEDVCGRKAIELERDTRFVRYTSFGWDCLTPTADGWVSLDRIIKAEVSEP